MAGDFYHSSPQTSQLRSSSSTRQALLDTINPEMTEQDINQAANRINTVYDQRKNELRRRYQDFPEMASSEETALERDRANELAQVSLDTKQKASASTRDLLLNLEQMDENKRRFDISDNARVASELNAGLRQHTINNAAKRVDDQSRQNWMGNYRPMQGPVQTRGDYVGMEGNNTRGNFLSTDDFISKKIHNPNYSPGRDFAVNRPGTAAYDAQMETGFLNDRILSGMRRPVKPATTTAPSRIMMLAGRSNLASRSRPNFRAIGA